MTAWRTRERPWRMVVWAAEVAAEGLAGGHGEGDFPEDVAFEGEEGKGAEVAGEVDDFGVGGGFVEGFVVGQDEGEDEKGAGAGAEEAVVGGDEEGDQGQEGEDEGERGMGALGMTEWTNDV